MSSIISRAEHVHGYKVRHQGHDVNTSLSLFTQNSRQEDHRQFKLLGAIYTIWVK